MGPLGGPTFGAAFTYLSRSGPSFGSVRRTQNWVRKNCCFGGGVCKCEATARGPAGCVLLGAKKSVLGYLALITRLL